METSISDRNPKLPGDKGAGSFDIGFEDFDADGDGIIDSKELTAAYDKDGDGVVDEEEFADMRAQMINRIDTMQGEGGVDPDLAARVKKLFLQHDIDLNGTLDLNEVIAVASQIEKDKKDISNMRKLIIWGAVAMLLLLAAMVCTSIGAIYLTQEQFVGGGSRM